MNTALTVDGLGFFLKRHLQLLDRTKRYYYHLKIAVDHEAEIAFVIGKEARM